MERATVVNSPKVPEMKGWSLRSKMLAAFGAPAAIILLATTLANTFGIPFTDHKGLYDQAISNSLRQLSLVAALKKERFDFWLSERMRAVRKLCRDPNVLQTVEQIAGHVSTAMISEEKNALQSSSSNAGSDNNSKFNGIIKYNSYVYNFSKISIGDAQTGIVFVSTDKNEIGKKVLGQKPFSEGLRAISEGFVSVSTEVDGKPNLVISQAIEAKSGAQVEKGRPLAVMFAYPNLDDILRPLLYTGKGLGQTGEVVLVNQDGTVQLFSKHPQTDGEWYRIPKHRFRAIPAILQKTGVIATEDSRGIPVLAAYQYLDMNSSNNWGLIVKQDQEEVLEPIRRQILVVLMLGTFGFISVVIVAVYSSNIVVRPVRLLAAVAKNVESGNLDLRAPIMSADELGILASKFNSMVDRIQNRHENLDAQVLARTLELVSTNEELSAEIALRAAAEQSLLQANHALKMRSACNQAVVRAQSDIAVMNEICRIIVEIGGYAMAWVGLAQNDAEKKLVPVAKYGFEDGYLDQVKFTWGEDEFGRGPGGMCIKLKSPYVVKHIATDPAFTPWRKEALKRKYLSCIALPLLENDWAYGALIIYSNRPETSDEEAINLLIEFASDLSFGIVAARNKQKIEVSEAALSKVNIEWQQTFDSVSDLMMVLDSQHKIRKANKATLEFLGIPKEQIYERPCYELMHKMTEPPLYCPHSRLLEDPGMHIMEVDDLGGDAYEVRVSPIYDSAGNLFGSVHISRNITERKSMERALAESRQRLQLALDSANDGLWDWNAASDEVYWSGKCYTMLGYEPGEFPPDLNTAKELIHQDDLARITEEFRTQFSSKQNSFAFEYRIRAKSGQWRWVLSRGSVVEHDESGNGIRIIGTNTDITDRKLAEQALQKSEERYRTLFETVPSATFLVLPDETILDANPACCSLFGVTKEEIIGSHMSQYYSTAAEQEIFLSQLHSAGFLKNFEWTVKRKDGTRRTCLVNASLWKPERNKVIGYIAVGVDVTESRLLETQLQQAQKMEAIGTLSGGIAHDFNNLLQVIVGYSELLLLEKAQDNQEYEDLSKILQAAHSGTELARRLLTFGRRVKSKTVPLDLNHHILQVEELLRRTIPKMIEIDLNLADDLAKFDADPVQLEQVLVNLTVNARDAMPDGGKLTISTNNVILDEDYSRLHLGVTPGPYILLSISDSGCGMDEKTVGHIFEPFFTTKELGRGTGLGLAMVFGIVAQHRGHIACRSKIGLGTTFDLYFPAVTDERKAPADLARTEAVAEGGMETVLIVDDEDYVRDLLKRILRNSGYNVMTAAGAVEALDLVSTTDRRIDLIILDLVMPGMGGKECLEKLLKLDPAAKIVVLSGLLPDADSEEFIRRHAKKFVSKPYNAKEILSVVREVLNDRP